MNKVEQIVFKREHIDLLDLKPTQLLNSSFTVDSKEMLSLLGLSGNGVVLKYKEVYLGVIGFFELWRGVYEVWAMPTVHIDNNIIPFARTVNEKLKGLLEVLPYVRVQMLIKNEIKLRRWAEYLGFICEGTLRKYSSSGENYSIWARVK